MNVLRTKMADWVALLLLSTIPGASGQATPPACNGSPIVGSPATSTMVDGNNQFLIRGGLLNEGGQNLFHDFRCFSIPTNGSAIFLNENAGIRNIIARVTGSEQSVIGGDLSTRLGPGFSARARVFLLNPNGVLFNGSSSIDLTALTVSTANSLQFDGGAMVSPDSTAADLMSVSGDPLHFDSLSNTGSVQFENSRILMTGGGDIMIIAKDVELRNDSRITTEGSQVFIAGAGAGNSIEFDINDRSRLPVMAHPATGTVSMEEFSGVSTSDASGGRIVIRGGMITLTKSNPVNPALEVASAGGNPGVGIDMNATHRLTLSRSQVSTGSGLGGTVSDIRIHAPIIRMDNEVEGRDASAIRTMGRGGDIRIEAATELMIRDGGIITDVAGGGIGGAISIDAGQLTITDRSSIRSLASESGTGGAIHAAITGDLSIDGNGATRLGQNGELIPETVGIVANTEGTGAGGAVTINVGGDLSIMNGGLIDSATFSDGDAGRIMVSAGNLKIDGENFEFATGITAFTVNQESPSAGRGGDIAVDVPGDIMISNGGEIDTSSFGSGRAGGVSVGALHASESIVIDKGAATRFTGIGSDASGGGNAGKVTVRAGSLAIDNGGLISAGVILRPLFDEAGNHLPPLSSSGSGGDVEVFANSISLSGVSAQQDDGTSIVESSAIYTGTQAGTSGAGGSVIIKALGEPSPSLELTGGAEIGASAEGIGAGGSVEIHLEGGRVGLDSGSSISARSGELGGGAGDVTLEAETISLRNSSSVSSTNQSASTIPGEPDDEKLAGSVKLIPGELRIHSSSLEVSSKGGNAGEIRIEGGSLLDFLDSEVVAEAFVDGGNVAIEGGRAIILDHSRVSANAIRGDGGNISLEALVILSNESVVTASSQLGVDGIVHLESQAVLTGSEDGLDVAPLDVSDQLQPECTKRLTTKSGSFIRAGRGGSARLPGGYLPSVRLHRVQ